MAYIGNPPAPQNITSSEITDGTIVNVDIASDAAIAASKIAGLGTAATTAATDYATAAQGTKADAALPKAGGAVTGAITTNSTFDGVDIATRDAVLTTTTTTANAALPKTGGAMTGAITTNSTFDGVDIATRDAVLTTTTTTANAALPKAGGTLTGAVSGTAATFSGELLANSYNENYAALSGTSPAVNCHNGNSFSLVLSGATTFTFTNPPASGTAYTFSVEIIQDSGGSGHTVTWPTSVDWPAATAPTLTATASAKDIFVFTTRDGGTNWYGFTAGQALA